MLDVLDFLMDSVGLGGAVLIAAILALILGGGARRRVLGVMLLVLSMPISAEMVALPLNASTMGLDAVVDDTPGDVVAVYGAGVFADTLGGMWPTRESLERATVGLALSQRMERPLIVSGGVVRPDLAAEALVLSAVMQLPAGTVLEQRARTTGENAEYVARIMRDRQWRSLILVTGRLHTRRAMAASITAGINIAAVIDASPPRQLTAMAFLPGVRGLAAWSPVFHEYVGILWYMLTGRIDPATLVG